MQQKASDGGPPDFDVEPRKLSPKRRDRQIGLRRDQRPNRVLMLSQRVPLMAAELARQTIACRLPLLHELDYAARTDVKASRRLAPGSASQNRQNQAVT
jgi:hypothetical protein